ncbi:uncharacterized protein NPIL_29241 [Nephila pilipes]|uniref:Uncharacterized protein n=1 Tax=Nephila pilipes TaxID=299642 RepID=A0A8X6R6L0_NEPPI|nr:uncharacterized protein NPIL_29241 [Nephila pilipes]
MHTLCVFGNITWFQLLLRVQKSTLASLVGRNGKIYFRLVDVAALLNTNGVYSFAKCSQIVAVQGKDVLPFLKDYPIVTKKTQLVPLNVVNNIVAAKFVSLGSSFEKILSAGYAFVPSVKSLLVESFKRPSFLNVLVCHEGAPVPNGVLV